MIRQFDTYVIVAVTTEKDGAGTDIWVCALPDGFNYNINGSYPMPKRGDVLIVCNLTKERFLLRTDDVSWKE